MPIHMEMRSIAIESIAIVLTYCSRLNVFEYPYMTIATDEDSMLLRKEDTNEFKEVAGLFA